MNILIPTDFSDTARNALKYAVSTFGADHKFILMNAYEEPRSTTSSMISLRDILLEASEDSLREELDYIKNELSLPNLDLKLEAVYGDAPSSIAHVMGSVEIDLVVMGTTGASGLKEVTIGSVAAGVIQKVKVPVIAVPAVLSSVGAAKVLFATDLREMDHPEIPQFFVELLRSQAAEVTILNISKDDSPLNEEQVQQSERISKQLAGIPHVFQTIHSKDVDEAIVDFATQQKMDMVVTTPRQGGWFQRLLKPSVSKQLAHHLHVPMLALNHA